MDEIEITQICLDIILKEGDLYDAISEREGVSIPKNSFFKNHLLLFSRILYGGVFLFDKIKDHFSPIEKIREAQQQIRKALGVNIDVVRSKKVVNPFSDEIFQRTNTPFLSIFFQNEKIDKEQYLENVKKIFHFCDLYEIDRIYLSESDIYRLFPNVDVEELKLDTIFLQDVLGISVEMNIPKDNSFQGFKVENDLLLSLDLYSLQRLITVLEKEKIDKKVLLFFKEHIKDTVIKNSIRAFIKDGDFDRLKEDVRKRLTLQMNEDGIYKDKQYGRIFEDIRIQKEYIHIATRDENGNIIENKFMKLSDYLSNLEYVDEEDMVIVIVFYLYLNNQKNLYEIDKESSISFYDCVYLSFKEKLKTKTKSKRVAGLATKSSHMVTKLLYIANNLLNTFFVLLMILFAGMSGDFVQSLLLGIDFMDATFFESLLKNIFTAYQASYDFEKDIVDTLLPDVDFSISDMFNSSHSTGDGKDSNNDQQLATITPLSDVELPAYFAQYYSTGAEYETGQLTYWVSSYDLDYSKFEQVEELFQISYSASRDYIDSSIRDGKFCFSYDYFYPVGDNYVITKIIISDKKDPSKNLIFTANRVQTNSILHSQGAIFDKNKDDSMMETVSMHSSRETLRNSITDAEKRLLWSMEDPEIIFTFGISEHEMNSFVSSFGDIEAYSSLSPDELREAITKGLGVSKTATIEEMFDKIKNKKYSKTPFRDAGVLKEIGSMSEKEFFETISSLDSIVCNLAATLAVNIDDDLIYVEGFCNTNQDEYLSASEAHAWAMRNSGEIVDITPSTGETQEKVKNIFETVMKWSAKNNVSIYASIFLAGMIISKIFGKKIRFSIKFDKIQKILTEKPIEQSYAKLMENLYGGINLPAQEKPVAFLERVEDEFNGFSLEELKELRQQIQHSSMKKELEPAMQLLEELPFIRENSQEIKKRMLSKRCK